MLIAVDPGQTDAGVAIFEDYELTSAFLARSTGWFKTARTAFQRLAKDFPKEVLFNATLVIEVPDIYKPRHLKGDPNDLTCLSQMGAALAGFLGTEPIEYLPKQWKGQVPKKIMIERIQSKLSDAEAKRIELPKAKSLHHNIYDAIGIGQFHLQRGAIRVRKRQKKNGHITGSRRGRRKASIH